MKASKRTLFYAVMWIQIRWDPHSFGSVGPDPHHWFYACLSENLFNVMSQQMFQLFYSHNYT